MAKHSLHTLISTFLLISSISGCQDVAELPSRNDCIVMISGETASPLNKLHDDPHLLVDASRALSIPVGGTAYKKDGEIYLQFTEQCDVREMLAKKLMYALFAAEAESLVYRSTGITPGPNTIDAMGDSWREKRGVSFEDN